MAEIPFETLLGAHEGTRGTAVSPPTHMLNLPGALTPTKTLYRPDEARGTLGKNYRSAVTRRGSEFETDATAADGNLLPWWLNLAVRGGVTTPTTPVGGTLSRLWQFTRNLTADDIRSATLYFGDPNLQVWQADFCMVDEITLENDATDDEGVLMFEVKGQGGKPIAVADPTVPASIVGQIYPAQLMQCWIDVASAIGTTAITGRLLSAKHTITTGVTYKHVAGGPAANLDFALVGRERISAITTELLLELPDLTEYNQWEANNTIRCRVRHNGPLIEGSLYHYIEVDTYGPFDGFEWDEHEGSNRVMKLIIEGEVDSTLGSDLRVAVQNTRTAL